MNIFTTFVKGGVGTIAYDGLNGGWFMYAGEVLRFYENKPYMMGHLVAISPNKVGNIKEFWFGLGDRDYPNKDIWEEEIDTLIIEDNTV